LPDLQNETLQDELFAQQQQYIDEELSFLTQAREQMQSYNEQFSARNMQENFLQGVQLPDPYDELYSPIEEEVPQQKQAPEAEPAPRRKKRKKKEGAAPRSKNKLQKQLLKLWDGVTSLWQKQNRKVRIGIVAAGVLVLCLILLLMPWNTREKELTIRRGVTIDSVDVSGLTRQEAIDLLARPLDEKIAGTRITLTYAGQSWDFDSTQLGLHHDLDSVVDRALALDRPNRLVDWISDLFKCREDARALETSVVVSEVILRTTLAQTCDIADETVVEGSVSFDPNAVSEAGLFTITAPRSGRTIDFTRLVADIRLAANAGGVHTIAISESATAPKHTLSELKLSVTCISQVSMNLSAYDDAQLKNIESALDHVNGVSIPSGKNFSFNTHAAPYSGENGYMMTQDETGEYYADGVSVAATLVYRAGLLGDMKLLTRFAPNTPVEYSAAGLDAAVSPTQDLVLKNNSDYPIYIRASISKGIATVSIYGMPLEDSVRVRVETEVLSYADTPAPNEVKNDGTHTLPEGAPLDLVPSTPACTVRTWRVYSDKFEREIYREQIGADSTYEQVVGIRIIP